MRKLGLKVGEKVIIKEKTYSLEITPAKSVADELRGSIKGDKKRSLHDPSGHPRE